MSARITGYTLVEAKALHELGVRNSGWYMTEAEHRGVLDVLVRQEAENQRLREALERIADWGDDLAVPSYWTVAREALAGDAE